MLLKGVFTNCRDELENPNLIDVPVEVKEAKKKKQSKVFAEAVSEEISDEEA